MGPGGGGISQVNKKTSAPPIARTTSNKIIRVLNLMHFAVHSAEIRRGAANAPICATLCYSKFMAILRQSICLWLHFETLKTAPHRINDRDVARWAVHDISYTISGRRGNERGDRRPSA